jgi:hypothetical protein
VLSANLVQFKAREKARVQLSAVMNSRSTVQEREREKSKGSDKELKCR